MLAWTKHDDGLRANGYVIRLVAPHLWVVTSVRPEDQTAVRIPEDPLATSSSLSGAKREAELLHAAGHRRLLLRRWLTTMLLSGCGIVFAAGAQAPWGFLATFALVLVALRSLGLILGMVLAPHVPKYEDFIYQ